MHLNANSWSLWGKKQQQGTLETASISYYSTDYLSNTTKIISSLWFLSCSLIISIMIYCVPVITNHCALNKRRKIIFAALNKSRGTEKFVTGDHFDQLTWSSLNKRVLSAWIFRGYKQSGKNKKQITRFIECFPDTLSFFSFTAQKQSRLEHFSGLITWRKKKKSHTKLIKEIQNTNVHISYLPRTKCGTEAPKQVSRKKAAHKIKSHEISFRIRKLQCL